MTTDWLQPWPSYRPKIIRKVCLATLESPGEIFSPRCRKDYGHDGEHSSGHGVGVRVQPIMWPNLGDSVFPEREEGYDDAE